MSRIKVNDTNQMTIDSYEKYMDAHIANTNHETSDNFKDEIIRSFQGVPSDARIFEVGSGFGKEARFLESLGYKAKLTDAAHSFVEYLRAHGYEAEVFNALKDEFDDSYDVVFANAVLLHFTPEETAAFCSKVYDALVPGGRFIFSVKQGEGEEISDSKLGSHRYFCFWSETGIRDVVAEAGFEKIEIAEVADYRPDKPGWLFVTAYKVRKNT